LARRVLFRLLAEDEDPEWLFEFGAKGPADEDLARRGRAILREAAAAALAQAGYEGDPRLRGAAKRIIERIASYLRSPLAQKPFVRVGNQHVLAAEAAPPSIFAMTWLELVARLGFLRRNENWSKLLDRFLDDRDHHGVWHPHKGTNVARSANSFVWSMYPLEDGLSGDERWTDITFRIGLIARVV